MCLLDSRQWKWRLASATMITCRSQAVFPRVMRSMWIPHPAIPAPICSRWAAWEVLTAAWEEALAEEMADRAETAAAVAVEMAETAVAAECRKGEYRWQNL